MTHSMPNEITAEASEKEFFYILPHRICRWQNIFHSKGTHKHNYRQLYAQWSNGDAKR